MKGNIVLLDDDVVFSRRLIALLESKDYEVHHFRVVADAISFLEKTDVDVLLFETILPGLNGPNFLEKIKELRGGLRVLALAAVPNVDMAVALMKKGALDYIKKPVNFETLGENIGKLLKADERPDSTRPGTPRSGAEDLGITAKCPQMLSIMEIVKKVAGTPVTVLVSGESGTGKELIAKAIHHFSDRRGNRFLAVNCGALTETLLESELFGHEKGSFTGASRDVKGIFEEADKGTVFLDEIGTLSPKLQVKLLRVLQDGEFKKVGSAKPVRVDIRIVAATNQDLKKEVMKGEFREDLYYRLNVVSIQLPPLRERGEDIYQLIQHLIKESSRELNRNIKSVSDEFVSALARYPWPGNIRELKNVIHKAILFANGNELSREQVPEEILHHRKAGFEILDRPYRQAKEIATEMFVKEYLERLLRKNRGSISKVAAESGIKRQSVHRMMKKYDLRKEKFKIS